MKRLVLCIGALSLGACAADSGSGIGGSRAPADAFARLRAEFSQAWRRADPEAVASFYAEDATYIGTAGDVVSGRDRLLIGFRREVPVFRGFRAEPVQFDSSGRLAWERGSYSASLELPGRAAQPVSGPYLIVYELGQDGRWRIKTHMAGRNR